MRVREHAANSPAMTAYPPSFGTRGMAVGGLLLPLLLLALVWSDGLFLSPGIAFLLALVAVGALYCFHAVNTWCEVGDEGLLLHNRLREKLGLGSGRRLLAWDEVLSMRFHKKRILFLNTVHGKRWILEGYDGLDLIAAEVERRLKARA